MSKLGGHHPLPSLLGGGKNRIEQAHDAMKASVGIGGSAQDGTIEAEWRFARASGLAAVTSFDERGAMQAFPDLATDHIPIYEEILKLSPPVDASEEERRQAVLARWLEIPDATNAGLEESLQAIDSRFSIVDPAEDDVRVTQAGRFFEPYATTVPDPGFGLPIGLQFTQKHTNYPNYSDHFVLIVLFALGGATVIPTVTEQQSLTDATIFLNRILPAWVSFRFIYDLTDFILDTSLLDLGGPLP